MTSSALSCASIMPTPIAVVHELAPGDQLDQPRGGLVRALLVRILEQDTELVAADARDHVALAHAALEQLGDLDQRLVARAMAESVVDRLEPVQIDEQHGRMAVIAADAGDQPLELALETPPVGKVDETVLVREMVELLDSLLQLRHLAAKAADFSRQPLHIRFICYLVRHCPRACPVKSPMQ